MVLRKDSVPWEMYLELEMANDLDHVKELNLENGMDSCLVL